MTRLGRTASAASLILVVVIGSLISAGTAAAQGTPYLDIPIATYVTTTKGEGFCAELGRTDPFSFARLVATHQTPQNYAAKVSKSVDQLVKDRFLTESDGKKIKAEAGAFSTVTTASN